MFPMATFKLLDGGAQRALIVCLPDAIFPKPFGFCLADTVLAKFYE